MTEIVRVILTVERVVRVEGSPVDDPVARGDGVVNLVGCVCRQWCAFPGTYIHGFDVFAARVDNDGDDIALTVVGGMHE